MEATESAVARVPVTQGLTETLALYDVKYAFGMKIYGEMDPSVTQPICIHHEASASLMAYGYARISGKPGVVTLNKAGTANVVMGMHEAQQSSVPLIILMDGMQPVADRQAFDHTSTTPLARCARSRRRSSRRGLPRATPSNFARHSGWRPRAGQAPSC